MRVHVSMLSFVLLTGSVLCACGGGGTGSVSNGGGNPPPPTPPATPTITTAQAQAGASIVTIADSTSGATIYYTLDGSTPTSSSQVYQAPFLVSTNMTVNAIAATSANGTSAVATQNFTAAQSGQLIWSDEFNEANGSNVAPSASTWTYDTGFQCCGNNEQETYCAPTSNTAPCSTSNPNAFVGTDGYLHIVAMNPSGTTYTSARMKTQGLFSFMYGRIEAKIMLPESQGMWPAFWLLGNNITKVSWPACGELDVMEHIDGANPPLSAGGAPLGYDWIAGSVHGGTSGSAELNGTQQYHANGFSAADWHVYGMIWKKGEIDYYVDTPTNIYATFKSTDATWANNMWPFDAGPQFVILNLAVGGDWPGNVDSTTVFPSSMLVDYVHIYAN